MKVGFTRMGDGTYQVIVEATNHEEDNVLQAVSDTGSIVAMGFTSKEHNQLILSTGVPPRVP